MVLGAGATRQAFRTQALEINPIYWLGSREMRVRWYPWIFLTSMAVIITFSCLVMNVRGVHYPTLIAIAFCFHLFFKQWFSHVAGAAFAADRDKGALELLLSSPLTVGDLVRGHALGLRRQFAGPILFMLAAEFTAWGYALATGSHFGENLLEPACVVVGVLVFLADLWALTWLGWWMGATSKNASRASSNTSLRILLVPCIVLAPVLVLLRFNTGVSPPWLLALALACYLFISVAVDVWFGGWARRKLLTELREVAVERYSHRDASETGWRSLIRLLRAPVKPQGGR